MSVQVSPLPSAVIELFACASASGSLTVADRYGLLAALLDDSLPLEEHYVIDRLLYGVRRGHVQVSDEISAIW